MRRHVIHAAAGAIAGCAAMLVFLGVHALTIVPIWNSVWTGVAWAIPVGAAMSLTASIVLGRRQRIRDGLVIGAIAWLGIALNTAASVALKAVRVPEMVEIAAAVLIALAFGAFVASRISHRRAHLAAGAFGSLVALIVVGGPVSHMINGRGPQILAGLLPVMVTFGLAQACLAHYVHPQGDNDAECNHDVEIGSRDGEAAAARVE